MIKNLFAKGKRGLIYITHFRGKKVVIKQKNPSSLAEGRIKNEAKFLRLLNKYKIGPKLVKIGKNYVMYEFVEGDFILNFIEKNNKRKIIKILKNILKQCFILDNLKINKLEMHHPIKHIIINKNPVLIDFERAYETENPKNVTQFCHFILQYSKFLKLNIKKDIFIKKIKKYKKNRTKKNFNSVLNIK